MADHCKYQTKCKKKATNPVSEKQSEKEYKHQCEQCEINRMSIKSSVKIAKRGGSIIINNSNSLVAEQVANLVKNSKTRLYIPQILLFSLTGILTFIVGFYKTILDILQHPIQKDICLIVKITDFIQDKAFLIPILWLLLCIITIILWCISAYCKKKWSKKLSKLLTFESKQNYLFYKFIISLGKYYCFQKDDFTKHISEELKGMISVVTINDISQDISNLIINKAINKEFIVADNANFLFDCYIVTKKGQDYCENQKQIQG